MPEVNYDLCTLDEIRIDLKLDSVDDYVDIIEALIHGVSDWIESSYCKRNFISREYTEQLDGKGREVIFLKNRPITAVESVHDDINGDFNSDTLITSDYYTLYGDEGMIKLKKDTNYFDTKTCFQDGSRNVQVVYTAGYAAVPKAVNLACRKMVVKLFRQMEKDGIKSESIGQYSVTYSDNKDVPFDIKILLDGYVNVKA